MRNGPQIDVRGSDDKTDISTQHAAARSQAWLPCTDANSRRPIDPESPEGQGSGSPLRLAESVSIPSLRSSTDFERVMRSGRRARRGPLAVHVRPLDGSDDATRVGLAVRGDRAVDRNLLKRRMRSAWQSYSPVPGFEVVIRASDGALSLDYQELETGLIEALGEAGLRRACP